MANARDVRRELGQARADDEQSMPLKITASSAFSDSSDDELTPTTPTMPIRRVSLLTQSKPAQANSPTTTSGTASSPSVTLTLDPATLNEFWTQATATVDHQAAQPHALEVWRVEPDVRTAI